MDGSLNGIGPERLVAGWPGWNEEVAWGGESGHRWCEGFNMLRR